MENNQSRPLVSLIVPVYNEEAALPEFFIALQKVWNDLKVRYNLEIIFVNDGSEDASKRELEKISRELVSEPKVEVRILEFSRNFGKEAALSAGLTAAQGGAVLMIDADLQHPPEMIPAFIKKWEEGAEVVIGLRDKNQAGWLKRAGSWLFYGIIKCISEIDLRAGETDFRLLDREVVKAFNELAEKRRMVRALIDWLGFKREYITFQGARRQEGKAGYSLRKLISLAMNSFVSLSLVPLKIAGYLGVFIIFTFGPFGLYLLIGKYFTGSSFASSFSGSAQLAVLLTFLIGVVLSSLGLVALYIAHIHNEVLDRPLYIIREKKRGRDNQAL